MQPEDIKFEKEIYDNVIGFVGITKLELEIINTPIFQRLRNIKQLGLANYVFPGALQNRFNHSIGVLHYADEMVCSLQKKEFLEEVREIVRIAALLHDIGHYPLSHITEKIVREEARSIPLPDKLITLEQLSLEENKPIYEKKFNHPLHKLNLKLHAYLNFDRDYAHHERMGNLVIQKTEILQILKKQFNKKEIYKIQKLISGIDPSAEKSIIHSELDADKFDYLVRDSNQTGVIYGVFDVDQIIKHLELSDEGEVVAGEKSKRAVEHYLMSKYFLYSQVIHHKTVASFNLMAERIYKGLLEREIAWSYKNLLNKLDDLHQPSYLMFDDEYFFNLMKEVDKGEKQLPKNEGYTVGDEELKMFIKMVLYRQRLKLVEERQELSEKSKDKEDKTRKIKKFSETVISSLCKEAGIERWWFIEDEISVLPTKINPYRNWNSDSGSTAENEAIKVLAPVYDRNGNTVYDDNGKEKRRAEFLINDKSSIIKPLSLFQLNIGRIYTKDEDYKQKLKIAIRNHRNSLSEI